MGAMRGGLERAAPVKVQMDWPIIEIRKAFSAVRAGEQVYANSDRHPAIRDTTCRKEVEPILVLAAT
ncbi:hypothetical protein [Thiocapsa imhoffii]|uniref:hypothetical protein n=1 Tax=Thiocapsa imhoffii TaxID=382777 RepID=UPI001905FE97|nr:hypothetical protein [Thiocapsa imhoffii]